MLKKIFLKFSTTAALLSDLPPLIFRLILAYGFYQPAILKLSDINAVVIWFTEMKIPLPTLNAYMAASTEALGVLLLTMGLATRVISIPLMFVMVVAVVTVHLENGFSCSKNGYEIPFYYFFMLFSLLVTGPGKVSLDYFIKRSTLENPKT